MLSQSQWKGQPHWLPTNNDRWAIHDGVGRERGERSISTRRNGSLTVRQEKLAGIKKRQIENAYISDSWQPHSLFQIGHKFMIFHNCSCFDTSYFNPENEWEKSTLGVFFFKKEFRVLPCEKLILNAKRVNSAAHSSPSPLNFATVLQDLWHTGGCAPSYCEELHLQKHSRLDSWIFIHWLGALIYQAATERNDGS